MILKPMYCIKHMCLYSAAIGLSPGDFRDKQMHKTYCSRV